MSIWVGGPYDLTLKVEIRECDTCPRSNFQGLLMKQNYTSIFKGEGTREDFKKFKITSEIWSKIIF